MRWSPFSPYLPRYPGPHQVGTIELELPVPKELQETFGTSTVRTLLVRLFYPTAEKHGRRPKWVGHGNYSVQGYAKFLGIRESLLTAASYLGLRWTQIPAISEAPLLSPTTHSSSRLWPCMVFSHGLGGTRNAYSQICGSLASGGLVVMAVEHRDNSAAISVVAAPAPGESDSSGRDEVVDYVSIKDSTPENIAKRRAQMAQRAYETRLAIALFRAMQDPHDTETFETSALPELESFRGQLGTERGAFLMAGHSFGAATGVHCCKDTLTRLKHDREDYSLREEFRALVLLDVWMEVLVDSRAARLDVPAICIASQAFHDWSSNWHSVVELLKGGDGGKGGNKLCWVKDSAHLSQSDFQLLFPTATRYAFKAAIDPHKAMELNVRAVREFLRGQGIGEEKPDAGIFDGSEEKLVMHAW